MKDEVGVWLKYAEENLQSARVLLESELHNPCLQNLQQAVEKALKALLVERTGVVKRTHSIGELKELLSRNGVIIKITDERCDLFDSIYLPSKYPLGSALPLFEPDAGICQECLATADAVVSQTRRILRASDGKG